MIPLGILTAAKEYIFLLDLYPGASSAYSFRKLRSAYTGPCITAYSNGNVLDIGFVSSYIDITTLMTFAGSNSVQILNWYDQSGNGNTAFGNISNAPFIVISGVLQTKNSLVTGFYNSAGRQLPAYKFAAPSNDWSYACVANINSILTNTILSSDGNGFNNNGIYNSTTGLVVNKTGANAGVGVGVSTTNLNTTSCVYYSNNTAIFSQNNTSSALTSMLLGGTPYTNSSYTNYFLGLYREPGGSVSVTNSLIGNISEFITYQNSTTNLNDIRTNQITFYSII
jgi:hypothetical protein